MSKKKKKRTNNEEKSFAFQHWRAFESLSLLIIKDLYREEPQSFSQLTSERKDGGYDGIICFPSYTNSVPELHKVLMEAKLRSDNGKDLPLSDFAKTIIIAVNCVADKVYISTNTFFTRETVNRLKRYSQLTGLKINTLDIDYIVRWLHSHTSEADAFHDQKLISKLCEMNRVLRSEQQELSPKNADKEDSSPQTLIGDERIRILHDATELLKHQNGVMCVEGTMGQGKTVFLANLIHQIKKHYRTITKLDMSYYSDARSVFIKILSAIWGVPTDVVYSMTTDELRQITEYLGDEKFPEQSRHVLISLIRQPQADFEARQSIHSELLFDYLKIIAPSVLKRARSLWVISGVKHATENALYFLLGCIRILQGNQISILIEIEAEEKTSRLFMSEIERTQLFLGTVILPEWDNSSAHLFLTHKSPELSQEERKALIQQFGYNPLALSVGADIYCNSALASVISLIRDELSTGQIRPQYTVACIDHLVCAFAAKGPEQQCSLAILGLLDGVADTSLIESVAASLNLRSAIPAISMCSFLQRANKKVKILHDAYTISIKKLNYISHAFLYAVLTSTGQLLENYYPDTVYVMRKRFDISVVLRDFPQISAMWKPLAVGYIKRGENLCAYEVLSKVYRFWMDDPSTNELSTDSKLWILFHLARLTYSLYGAEEQALQHYLNQLDAIINLSDNDTKGANIDYHSRVLNLKCSIFLGKADYHQMKKYAEEGIALLTQRKPLTDLSTLGSLWANKAMAIKHLNNLQDAIEFFHFGRKILWNVDTFMYSYYTHLAGLFTMRSPKAAIYCFRKAKEVPIISLSQLLHVDHNIASMHFLLEEYDTAFRLSSQTWLKAYENHIPIEEGRSDHLLGCIAWIKGNTDSAYERFHAAGELFKRHVHRTHLWPPLINLASLCMETGKKEEAIAYCIEAADFLLKYHLENINHLKLNEPILPKMYVGVLFLLDYCFHTAQKQLIETLLAKIELSGLKQTFQNYIITGRLNDYLRDSGYICRGKRILKI